MFDRKVIICIDFHRYVMKNISMRLCFGMAWKLQLNVHFYFPRPPEKNDRKNGISVLGLAHVLVCCQELFVIEYLFLSK